MKSYSQSIRALGLEWHFTEVTVGTTTTSGGSYMDATEQVAQATLYKGLLEACLELGVSSCPVFQTWGAADAYTTAYTDLKVFLFDVDDAPKASYTAVVEAVQN